VDDNNAVTGTFYKALEHNNFAPLREDLSYLADGIYKLVQAVFDPDVMEEMIENGHGTKIRENPLNENWKDFRDLWDRINKKYAYIVDFKSQDLIEKSADMINKELHIAKPAYILTRGVQEGAEFKTEKTSAKTLERHGSGYAKYDLIGKIGEATTLTRSTVSKILKNIIPDKLMLFSENPEEFISKVSHIINSQKAAIVVEHITYAPSAEEPYTQDIFNMSGSSEEFAKAFKAKHAIQDYIFTDGTAAKSVERKFAEDLDNADEVIVYAKLPRGPRGFYIPTPVGDYSPDWAISFKKGTVKHIFFIAETKGTMDSLELRQLEKSKISCAKKLFNEISTTGVKYHDVDSYQNLLSIMNTI
jgi:type III restriction enzyme